MRISDWSSDVCSSDLRIALAPEDVAAQRAGQETRVLIGRAEADDRRPDHVNAERRRWRAGSEALTRKQIALPGAPFAAAVFALPAWRTPTARMQPLLPPIGRALCRERRWLYV